MKWIEGIQINQIDKKIEQFEKMSVYTECHNDGGNAFIDTFCIAILEGMACGLPVVIYKGFQEPIAEVVGEAGIICTTIKGYQIALCTMLNHTKIKREYGEMAKKRAAFFHKNKMIKKWNTLLRNI